MHKIRQLVYNINIKIIKEEVGNEKIRIIKNSLVGKELNFGEIENIIESVVEISYEDSFYYEDNKYYAFENMNIDYAVNESESLRIEFEVNTEEDFDIYEDSVKIVNVKYI